MMSSLPEADPATLAFFEDWLDRFAAVVRASDDAAARALMHPEILAYGTLPAGGDGKERSPRLQCLKDWPQAGEFRFVQESVRVFTSGDDSIAVVMAPWTSDRGADGAQAGRATLVFHRLEGQDWLCVHSHASRAPAPAQEGGRKRRIARAPRREQAAG